MAGKDDVTDGADARITSLGVDELAMPALLLFDQQHGHLTARV
jgi:hypothetical protein